MLRAAATAVRSVSLKPTHPLSGVYADVTLSRLLQSYSLSNDKLGSFSKSMNQLLSDSIHAGVWFFPGPTGSCRPAEGA